MAAGDALDHPLVEPGVLERREYQVAMAETARRDHTLVCLPTGLGKTTVSLLVTAHRLDAVGGRSLLLAPTKPLVEQHAVFYREALSVPDEDIVVFTGEVRPADRADLWDDARVVVATPQVVENDLVGNRISLANVTHVTFDECHRAAGEYAYCYIAERYHGEADDPLVTGMSASPGGDEEEILRVCENLGIREVEVMTEDDADVAAHTYATTLDWEHVELPEAILSIRDDLRDVIADRLERLVDIGVARTTDPNLSQDQLDAMRGRLQERIDRGDSAGYEGMSIHAEVMKLRRAVELVETQSVESLRRYFERQREDARSSGASKASQRFVSEPRVRTAMERAEAYDDLHPKFRRARILLARALGVEGGERAIVFTESRDTAEALTEFLGEHFATRRFVGQGDRDGSDGMTQREQGQTLEAFRDGEFEVLVSTSVAEEGLHVPDVDLVLFYEPVPKGIRSIQRKGRTGRQREGAVVVLIAEDTRDEAFYWKSKREEDRMEAELRKLKGAADDIEAELEEGQGSLAEFGGGQEDGSADGDQNDEQDGNPDGHRDGARGASDGHGGAASGDGQRGLDAFGGEGPNPPATDDDAVVPTPAADGDGVEIVVDQRELDATIARDLSTREGIETRLATLAVGDYVCSDRVVVERKTVEDFLDTLVGDDERSVFEQVGDAARHYGRPVVIVEGEQLYDSRDVHPNAVRGALASLAVDFGASVLRTADADATVDLLAVLARREQEGRDRSVSVHGGKSGRTLREQQEYVVSSVAEVGPVTARSLLSALGSVEAVMTASLEELQAVDGVGEVTAERIREVVGSEYDS